MAIRLNKLQASDLDDLAEKVAAYRHELGWSQQNLAEEAGCSRPTIARLEAGNTILSVTIIKVIEALNRGIENQGLLMEQQGSSGAGGKGRARVHPRRSRRRRPEGDRRSEPRRSGQRDATPRDTAPKAEVEVTQNTTSAETRDTSDAHRSAHSGNGEGKTGEQLQREMFSGSAQPLFRAPREA